MNDTTKPKPETKRLYMLVVDKWRYIECNCKPDGSPIYPLEVVQFADTAFFVNPDGGAKLVKHKGASLMQVPVFERVKLLDEPIQKLRERRMEKWLKNNPEDLT